ncbi:AAA family ATPase [Pseudaestuariivita atlantica]|uniref:ATPase AAA n=1 Tax=Pseudaestuariivita atlantica TaxID=1317121 RepID=A0A0L1JSB9_9RHOB|nr:MoxR family ATPase [Pseudaestuariivita atlantica]KNG94597.1 ATPase AAA [Pseudaestuariivita atlantica]
MNIQASKPSVQTQVVDELRQHLKTCVVGQDAFIDKLLIALLSNGHILVEGAPGLAKTRAIVALSKAIDCDEKRVQFTPDLLPGDLTGTEVYRPEQGSFEFQKGPLFHNLILADEINRAPAKVQSALLEAMAERQITVGGESYPLPRLFMVMATQNPIEQEGTYPLPEAQLDRFLMHIRIGYPDAKSEHDILRIARGEALGDNATISRRIPQQEIFEARKAALDVHVSPALESYVLALIQATRHPETWDPELAEAVAWGASPRGSISLDRCARVHAMMRGSDYAAPSDVQAVAHDVLRHRVIPTFEAEADGMTSDKLIDRLLELVPVT